MYQDEWETGYEFEPPGEAEYEGFGEPYPDDSPLHEVEEMEYAAHLLGVNSEDELEDFLGGLLKKVARAAGGGIGGPAAKILTGVLKTAAKQALPMVGGALGTMIAPGAGTALGTRIGSAASNLFEMELEGMDAEQAEFETARRYVRFAAAAANDAALAPPDIPPPAVAHEAAASAAERFAPGLLPHLGGANGVAGHPGPGSPPRGHAQRSGRWVRHGRRIILYGV